MTTTSDYGLWWLVILNTAIFLIFASSFTHPKTKRDWRSFGAFSAFIVALFTHNSGHLLEDLIGWSGDPHMGPFHIASDILIVIGFIILANSWRVLYRAQQEHALATEGPYVLIRHPQYIAFIIIMFGFLLQWPTILTLIMFPILVYMYTRLAKSEEREAGKEFGVVWDDYAKRTPAFIPRLAQSESNEDIWKHS